MSSAVSISRCSVLSRTRKWHELHDNEYFREYRKSVDTAAVLADLPERYSVSVPPVSNNICRSAERRSAAFRHHSTTARDVSDIRFRFRPSCSQKPDI